MFVLMLVLVLMIVVSSYVEGAVGAVVVVFDDLIDVVLQCCTQTERSCCVFGVGTDPWMVYLMA